MAIIATICLLAAGIILCMAAAKHEYSRQFLIDKQTGKNETHQRQKVSEGALLETVLFLLSIIVMVTSAVFWVAWEFFFEIALEGYMHAVFCTLWVVSCYWAGVRVGRVFARFN